MRDNIIENSWRPVKIRLEGIWARTPWLPGAKQARAANEKELQKTALSTWEDEGGKTSPAAPAKSGS